MSIFKLSLAPLRCIDNYTQTVGITLLPYTFKIRTRWVVTRLYAPIVLFKTVQSETYWVLRETTSPLMFERKRKCFGSMILQIYVKYFRVCKLEVIFFLFTFVSC